MAIAEPGKTKLDRDEVYVEDTKSVCPTCKTVTGADVNVRGNRVIPITPRDSPWSS